MGEKEATARKAAGTKEQRLEKDFSQLSQEQSNLSQDFAASSGRNEGGSVAPVKKRKKSKSFRVAKEPEKAKEAESGSSFEFKLPSFSAPGAPAESVANKVIISPADEIDDDERSLNATNLPLLFALFFGPSFVYLSFYVLGSLDII